MPKLAIYIPKKEMRVIDKWRKRINFSQVFMQALAQEIRHRSRIVDSDKGRLQAAAQFYKRKIAEDSQSLVDFGHQLGYRQILDCQLPPDTIRRLVQLRQSEDWQEEDLKLVEQTLGKENLDAADALVKGDENLQKAAMQHVVFRGFVEGVADAWQQICDQM